MREIRNRVLSGGAWVTGGKVAAVAAIAASNALLARLLPPADVGVYFLIQSVATTLATLSSLGLHVTVVRLAGDALGRGDPGRARRAVQLALALGTSGAAAGALLLVSGPGLVLARRGFDSATMAALVPYMAVLVLATALQTLVAESFRGLHDLRSSTLFGGVVAPVTTVIPFAIAWFARPAALTLRMVLIVTIVPVAAWAVAGLLLLLRKLDPAPPATDLTASEVLQKTWPVWITAMGLAVVNGVDLWIVGAFVGGEPVAWYGAASRLAGWLATPLTLVNGVVPPLIATLYARNRRAELQNVLQGTAAAAAVPSLLLMAVVAAFSGDVLSLIFGAPYRGAAWIATLLLAGQAVNLLSGSCATTLIMTGHQRIAMTVTLACSAITITFALLLVASHRATGVAVATTCGLMLQNTVMWWMARRTTGLDTHASIPALVRLLRQRDPQA